MCVATRKVLQLTDLIPICLTIMPKVLQWGTVQGIIHHAEWHWIFVQWCLLNWQGRGGSQIQGIFVDTNLMRESISARTLFLLGIYSWVKTNYWTKDSITASKNCQGLWYYWMPNSSSYVEDPFYAQTIYQ